MVASVKYGHFANQTLYYLYTHRIISTAGATPTARTTLADSEPRLANIAKTRLAHASTAPHGRHPTRYAERSQGSVRKPPERRAGDTRAIRTCRSAMAACHRLDDGLSTARHKLHTIVTRLEACSFSMNPA